METLKGNRKDISDLTLFSREAHDLDTGTKTGQNAVN